MKQRFSTQQILFFSMKLFLSQSILAVLFSGMALAAEVKGQDLLDKKISLQAGNRSLKSVLTEIEQLAEAHFMYSSSLILPDKTVTVTARKERLGAVLEKILQPHNLTYQVSGQHIVIQRQKQDKGTGQISPPKNNPPNELNDRQTGDANLADFVVTGTVTDARNEPLIGASVALEGATKGSITDGTGKFRLVLDDAEKNGVLVVTLVGYERQRAALEGRNDLTIVMQEAGILDELVVVGYGSVKKSDLTGAVSSVKAEQLTAYPAGGVSQALQGRAAGVLIQANNGDPGGSFKIRIRGSSSINASSDPIFVIDGFVGGQLPPPEDIQSIEILKDASATAIYGSRGANGVVMITTKQGKEGKTTIEYNASFSSQTEINRLELLNAEQYSDYMKEVIPAYVSPGGSTDWQDEIFRRGAIHNHQLSFAGGNKSVKYYLSGSIFDQAGVIIGTDFRRYSLTNNISFQVNEKIRVGMNVFAQRTNRNGTRTQEGSGGANSAGAVSSAFKFMPNQGIYKADGTYSIALQGDPIDNPYAIITELQNEGLNDRVQANFSGEYDIFKSLKFRTTFGASVNNQREGIFEPTTLNQGRNTGGDATIAAEKNLTLITENYLTYSKTLADAHNISLLGGYSFQQNRFESWSARSQSFITNSVQFWNLGSASVFQSPTSNLAEVQLESYFGRLNYGFKDRYLLTFNARYDGSSNFSKNFKWAFFPSGAVAWNIMNEPFMQKVGFLDAWKIRVSYGLTGNQAIGPYQTLARFSSVLAVINGKQVTAVRPTSIANENLTWETTAQFDIGTDISFWNNRINLTFDYYDRQTRDLLFSVPLPQYSGYQSQLKNIGKVSNKGVELGLQSKLLTGAFKWSIDLNISANRNKVLELPNNTDIQYGAGPGHMVGLGNTQVLRVGQPIGSFFGWVYDGVYQNGDAFLPGGGFERVAGGEKYRDIAGKKDANGQLTGEADGQLNADDRTIIGDPNPDFIWGIGSDFAWKGFDLNVFFQGSQGNDILSFTLLEIESMASPYNATTRALNRWTPTNTNTDIPVRSIGRSQRASTRWVYDGSFARLKNLAIGYSLKPSGNASRAIQKIRLYASAQNILTFTQYPGYDPEVNYNNSGETANSNRNLGLDYGSYPNAKSYTVGLNVTF